MDDKYYAPATLLPRKETPYPFNVHQGLLYLG
jgi:hypothetical protein